MREYDAEDDGRRDEISISFGAVYFLYSTVIVLPL